MAGKFVRELLKLMVDDGECRPFVTFLSARLTLPSARRLTTDANKLPE